MLEVSQTGTRSHARIVFGADEPLLIASLHHFAAASTTYVDQAAAAAELAQELEKQP